ncbi:1064_t:CDS:2 [Funneliformis geosporum]|nr:1064_t:CDS:2 [Funneliformis geosporum]
MIVALKFFKSDANSQDTDKALWKEFVRELTHLRNVFYHPHINQFIGITKGGDKFDYAMVLQYADGGNLQDFLANKSIPLTWSDNYRIALEISEGLLCLHAEGIIQRDLHSKNVLIHQGKMLIADFGMSKEESASFSNSKNKGRPAYMDPQCFTQINYKRTKKSDIFSFGMILWEISSRRVPFANLADFKVIMKIAVGDREQRVDGTPEPYFQLYSKCWKSDPEERPDITEVVETLEHCYLEFGGDTLISIPKINLHSDILNVSRIALSVPNSNTITSDLNYLINKDLCL